MSKDNENKEELTYLQAESKAMTWADVVKLYHPDSDENKVVEIHQDAIKKAQMDSYLGRRNEVPNEYIFNNIKYRQKP